jgi:hypothetical protein
MIIRVIVRPDRSCGKHRSQDEKGQQPCLFGHHLPRPLLNPRLLFACAPADVGPKSEHVKSEHYRARKQAADR